LDQKDCNEIGSDFTIRMIMDHSQALSTHASERYLLGEMSEPERFDFEDHYFDCGECAEDVRAANAFARGVRAVCAQDGASARTPLVMQEKVTRARFAWLSPASLLPMAASLMLASFVGYQSLVTIPQLRSSRALSPIVLRAAARGDEQTVELRRDQPYSVLSLDVNAADPGTPLVYEVSPQNGSARAKGETTAPPPGSPLLVVIPHSDLNQAGPWTLVLHTPQGKEISRYPFSLKLN
jgi:hypothetical protein